MKNLVIIILFLFVDNLFGQNEKLSNELINDIIKTSPKYNQPKIISKLDSVNIEYHLKNLIENKSNTFYYGKGKLKDSIILTKTEKEFLITTIRQQYKNEWNDKDFEKYKVIKEAKGYLNIDTKNALVSISKPIFFRENKIALVFYANYFFRSTGFNELSFYRKDNDRWKNWASIGAVYY